MSTLFRSFEIRLKELRKEKNLTQKELAQIFSTTDDSIFSWEKGRSQPSIDTIRKFCEFFEVSADYLLGIEDEYGKTFTVATEKRAETKSEEESGLLRSYRKLSATGKARVAAYADLLSEQEADRHK